jgi:hypothetical protein
MWHTTLGRAQSCPVRREKQRRAEGVHAAELLIGRGEVVDELTAEKDREDVDAVPSPAFSVSEVSSVFFAQDNDKFSQ